MIYVQLRARVKLAQGETLHVADAAETPDTLEWDWTWGGFWRALFGYSA